MAKHSKDQRNILRELAAPVSPYRSEPAYRIGQVLGEGRVHSRLYQFTGSDDYTGWLYVIQTGAGKRRTIREDQLKLSTMKGA